MTDTHSRLGAGGLATALSLTLLGRADLLDPQLAGALLLATLLLLALLPTFPEPGPRW